MPLYEYRCRNCDHQFEVQQSFTDDALTVCPECEGALRKVFAPVGIAFKGSGFYKNDSRSGSGSSGSSSSGDSSGTGSSSTGSSGESSSSSSGEGTTKKDSTPAASTSSSSD
jgi:putative FmdB family regulatory protein